MSKPRKTQKVAIIAITFVAAAFIGSEVAIAGDNNAVFVTKKLSNDSFQDII